MSGNVDLRGGFSLKINFWVAKLATINMMSSFIKRRLTALAVHSGIDHIWKKIEKDSQERFSFRIFTLAWASQVVLILGRR